MIATVIPITKIGQYMTENNSPDVHVMQLLVLSEILSLLDNHVSKEPYIESDRIRILKLQALVRKTTTRYLAE